MEDEHVGQQQRWWRCWITSQPSVSSSGLLCLSVHLCWARSKRPGNFLWIPNYQKCHLDVYVWVTLSEAGSGAEFMSWHFLLSYLSLPIVCLSAHLRLILFSAQSPTGFWMPLSSSTVDPPDPPIVPHPSIKISPTYIRTSTQLAFIVGKLSHMRIWFNIFLLIYHNLKHRYVFAQWISQWTAFYYNFDDDGAFLNKRTQQNVCFVAGWLFVILIIIGPEN